MKWEKIFASDVTKQGINIQNIQTTHTTQYWKKNNKKMDRKSKQTFLQQAHVKMLNITNY